MVPASVHPSRPLRLYRRLLRWALWGVAGLFALFALSWGVLHGLIVPRIADWRPELEQLASRRLGVRVQVGDLSAQAGGRSAAVTLRDVRLFDPQGRETLHLPRVQGQLSVPSLWRLGFEQLVVESPTLEVRRTAQGRIEVAGIDVSAPTAQNSNALSDWVLAQPELAVRQGQVRWRDDLRPQAPALALAAVDLVLRNSGRQHRFRLDATPPAAWGERFTLRAEMRDALWPLAPGSRDADGAMPWRRWNGTLYADAPRIDLQRLRQHLDTQSWLGLEVREGAGALRLWAELQQGTWREATVDAAWRTVALAFAPDRPALALNDLSGRFTLRRDGPRLDIATTGLAFQTREGQTWPGGNLRYGQVLDRTGQIGALDLQAQQLDLIALRQLAGHLPLPESVQTELQALAPSGLVERLDAHWEAGAGATPARWRASGEVRGLALQAGATPAPAANGATPDLGRPGLAGADVRFQATDGGGQAQLSLRDGHLSFPGMFEEPLLPFDRLDGDFAWRVQGPDIRLDIRQLRFANPDASGQAQGHWRTSDPATSGARARLPGVLDLQAQLDRANGARVWRYLPQGIPSEVRQYVREAVRQGQAQHASFRVRGDLWDFPFPQPQQGEFRVQAQLQGVEFAYVPAHLNAPDSPPWPLVERLNAHLDIDRVALRIRGGQGRVLGMPQLQATQAEAELPNVMADQPQLRVQAQVHGPASDALAFVNRSPLLDLTGQALQQARIDGPAQVQFRLDLPLNQVEATRVQGQVRFQNNSLQVTPDTPRLEQANGVLTFTETGFELGPSTARVLGGPLQFSGGMRTVDGHSRIQFQGQGQATAEGLRQAREWPWLQPLARAASGRAQYQVQLGFRDGGTELLVNSNLQGLGLALPPPLNKDATSALPLRYQVQLQPHPPNEPPRDLMTLDVGDLLQARFERRQDPTTVRVLRGAMALGSALPPVPDQGVHAQLQLRELDLQAWQQAWEGDGAAPTGGASSDLGPGYWPTRVAATIERLVHDGRRFHQVVVGASQDQAVWRANLQARELDGYLEYRPPQGPAAGRVHARLARLSLPPSAASDVEQLLQSAPSQMPALDIVVDQFVLNDRPLGRLEIDAVNRGASLAARSSSREWRLNTFNLSVPEARLQASGNWAAVANAPPGQATRRTVLALKLNVSDAGALLTRFGMPGVLRGGQGSLEGTLGWLGTPMALHYPSLGGELALLLERGQFLKADPGLAKLLGVLNLQALPRRLTLDFRDVFSEGFAFDFVRGNARIEQGVASTNNLQMKGVNAAVLLEGSADLARETQDITAVVIPEINAGTAALIATFINPATGIGSFVAQFLLGKPLKEAATQTFRITGPWTDPKVEKTARSAVNLEPPREGNPP